LYRPGGISNPEALSFIAAKKHIWKLVHGEIEIFDELKDDWKPVDSLPFSEIREVPGQGLLGMSEEGAVWIEYIDQKIKTSPVVAGVSFDSVEIKGDITEVLPFEEPETLPSIYD
jgi:hypothetical protein